MFGSVVLYPSDPNQTVALLDAMREHRGISYMRTTRGATADPLRAGSSRFEIGGSRTLRSGGDDEITLIGAGITLHECLAAADQLAEQGSRRQGDRPLLGEAGRRRDDPRGRRRDAGPDHGRGPLAGGGIGETVAGVLAAAGSSTPLTSLAVSGRPGSGPPDELLAAAGIDAASIVVAAGSV